MKDSSGTSPHFLDIPGTTARDPECPYCVLPLPYERTVSFGEGTAMGPNRILIASHEIEDWDEELDLPMDLNVHTMPTPKLDDLAESDVMELISGCAYPVMKSNRFLMSLGGEHSVTAPLVEALSRASGSRDFAVLQIDAHLDLRDTYQGSPLSHACVMRRVRDLGIETFNLGARSASLEEKEYAAHNNVKVCWAADTRNERENRWIDMLIDSLPPRVYLSVDVDGLDPSVMPGTGTPEPGGLGWTMALSFLRALFSRRKVMACDIVELSPIAGSVLSEFVAARLAAKILIYHRYAHAL